MRFKPLNRNLSILIDPAIFFFFLSYRCLAGPLCSVQRPHLVSRPRHIRTCSICRFFTNTSRSRLFTCDIIACFDEPDTNTDDITLSRASTYLTIPPAVPRDTMSFQSSKVWNIIYGRPVLLVLGRTCPLRPCVSPLSPHTLRVMRRK